LRVHVEADGLEPEVASLRPSPCGDEQHLRVQLGSVLERDPPAAGGVVRENGPDTGTDADAAVVERGLDESWLANGSSRESSRGRESRAG
jgi:hypothetical protein